ncbi:MAG TPA: hypothetical protein EYO75_06355 [Sulfurimonas sp.]|nr:hypothetical protein [Sulfurimonas sp.]HIM74959.1 hypothetical protein [Campylobacterales bacterium]
MGTVFNPCISKFIFSHFNEHLILGIYLESVFFKLLGPAYFVERLFSLLFVFFFEILKETIPLLISSLIFTIDKTGKYSRDEGRLNDLQHIATIIQPDTILHTTPRIHDDSSLNSYFMKK